VADNAAVLYDAPSVKSRKVYVVSQGYPVEVVVVVEGWSKVRDASGDLTWIESKRLSDKRTVLVKAILPNRDLALRPGQFATVALTLAHHTNAIVVPITIDDASSRASCLRTRESGQGCSAYHSSQRGS